MAILKCKMCGGDLNIEQGITVCECEYCGTKQTVPSADNEKKLTLFTRANRLRFNSEFDKAAGIYESIVADFSEEAEAYWGLVLCKYGIEYVDDPATAKKIPTCHRSSFDSVMDDPNFELVMEYADTIARGIYRDEAKQIEELRRDIIEVSSKEEPYHIFICYKETAEDGNRTLDSVIAQDVYDALTEKGYRVFFSRITLEDKLGKEYEPYIFAALNSAKVMLAFGTSYDHYNAVWVKNEWSRFLQLIAKGEKKTLIPCYKGIDAYDMPKEFAKLQAQDMGKVGAIQDLMRGIEKILPKNNPVKETVVIQQSASNPTTESLLKRAFMALEDGEWDKADGFCEQVLNASPECAEAYLGKLMAELWAKKRESLKFSPEPFDDNHNYQKIMRFGDEKIKKELEGYLKNVFERKEKERIAEVYNNAKSCMRTQSTEDDLKKAAEDFKSISDYKDSAELAEKCLQMAENIRLGREAKEEYERRLAEEERKRKAAEQEKERREREQRTAAYRRAEKRKKKIIAVVVASVCVIIAFIIVWNTVIAPTIKYNEAVALVNSGKLQEAYSIFVELGKFKDSYDKSADIRLTFTKEQLKDLEVGDYITFGVYEQDDNEKNGKEQVEWLVLDIVDGRALIISKYVLDARAYDYADNGDVTWETCALRGWLNDEFINTTFSDKEQALIPIVTVSADKNPEYDSIDPGNETEDKVFLLSEAEIQKYFGDIEHKENRVCKATDYAVKRKVYVDKDSGNSLWWLRTPGLFDVTIVQEDGAVDLLGSDATNNARGLRPAMWIELE